ncbi:MAG: hypothetical protein KGZ46_09560 [Hydrogenophaga sp.]|jgi:hypothetical protein|nr:hypothetical protein [Hydrogenophaga sp.]
MNGSRAHLLRRLAVTAAVAATLLATLALYTRPDFMVGLADQLWSCF